jgi:hypothetical protein
MDSSRLTQKYKNQERDDFFNQEDDGRIIFEICLEVDDDDDNGDAFGIYNASCCIAD